MLCKVKVCDRPEYVRGYCLGHYTRLLRTGDPGVTPLRPRNGWKGGYVNPNGYRYVHVESKRRAEHRVVMEGILGRALLPGETVHHRNGIKHDNRPTNLQLRVSNHPPGQSVEDVLAWAHEIIQRYEVGGEVMHCLVS